MNSCRREALANEPGLLLAVIAVERTPDRWAPQKTEAQKFKTNTRKSSKATYCIVVWLPLFHVLKAVRATGLIEVFPEYGQR